MSLLTLATVALLSFGGPVHAFVSPSASAACRRAPFMSPADESDDTSAASDLPPSDPPPSLTLVDQVLSTGGTSPLWRVGSAEFNVQGKHVVLHNFTIDNSPNNTFPERPNALEVGRVKVSWDNYWYTTRTFEVEMEDADTFIEFTTLKLGDVETNWDELMDLDLYDWLMAEYDEKGNKYDEEGYFHFSSIKFVGNGTVTLASRPLGVTIGSFTIDATNSQLAKEFDERIGQRSENNLGEKNRKGIMFSELYDVAKEFLDELIQSKLPGKLGGKASAR